MKKFKNVDDDEGYDQNGELESLHIKILAQEG